MSYVTYVWRSDPATTNGATLSNTIGQGNSTHHIVSGGWVVATPSSSGNVPYTMSSTAVCVYDGPSGITQQSGTMDPPGYRVIVRDVAAGECLWMTVTIWSDV